MNSSTDIPSELEKEINDLYMDMISQYFTTRSSKYLAPNHKRDFVTGVWKSIQQLKGANITQSMIDQGTDARIVDMFNDIVSTNVIFFLTDFNGEEQSLAEEQYHEYIKNRL